MRDAQRNERSRSQAAEQAHQQRKVFGCRIGQQTAHLVVGQFPEARRGQQRCLRRGCQRRGRSTSAELCRAWMGQRDPRLRNDDRRRSDRDRLGAIEKLDKPDRQKTKSQRCHQAQAGVSPVQGPPCALRQHRGFENLYAGLAPQFTGFQAEQALPRGKAHLFQAAHLFLHRLELGHAPGEGLHHLLVVGQLLLQAPRRRLGAGKLFLGLRECILPALAALAVQLLLEVGYPDSERTRIRVHVEVLRRELALQAAPLFPQLRQSLLEIGHRRIFLGLRCPFAFADRLLQCLNLSGGDGLTLRGHVERIAKSRQPRQGSVLAALGGDDVGLQAKRLHGLLSFGDPAFDHLGLFPRLGQFGQCRRLSRCRLLFAVSLDQAVDQSRQQRLLGALGLDLDDAGTFHPSHLEHVLHRQDRIGLDAAQFALFRQARDHFFQQGAAVEDLQLDQYGRRVVRCGCFTPRQLGRRCDLQPGAREVDRRAHEVVGQAGDCAEEEYAAEHNDPAAHDGAVAARRGDVVPWMWRGQCVEAPWRESAWTRLQVLHGTHPASLDNRALRSPFARCEAALTIDLRCMDFAGAGPSEPPRSRGHSMLSRRCGSLPKTLRIFRPMATPTRTGHGPRNFAPARRRLPLTSAPFFPGVNHHCVVRLGPVISQPTRGPDSSKRTRWVGTTPAAVGRRTTRNASSRASRDGLTSTRQAPGSGPAAPRFLMISAREPLSS